MSSRPEPKDVNPLSKEFWNKRESALAPPEIPMHPRTRWVFQALAAKRNVPWQTLATDTAADVLEYLIDAVQGNILDDKGNTDRNVQYQAAKELKQSLLPTLKAVEVTDKEGGPLKIIISREPYNNAGTKI